MAGDQSNYVAMYLDFIINYFYHRLLWTSKRLLGNQAKLI